MGYVAVSLLMKSEDEMMTLVVNSVRNDLVSHNNYFQVSWPYACDIFPSACFSVRAHLHAMPRSRSHLVAPDLIPNHPRLSIHHTTEPGPGLHRQHWRRRVRRGPHAGRAGRWFVCTSPHALPL